MTEPKLSDLQKQRILSMSGKDIFKEVTTNTKLSVKQKNEIFEFWLDQHNLKVNKRTD